MKLVQTQIDLAKIMNEGSLMESELLSLLGKIECANEMFNPSEDGQPKHQDSKCTFVFCMHIIYV